MLCEVHAGYFHLVDDNTQFCCFSTNYLLEAARQVCLASALFRALIPLAYFHGRVKPLIAKKKLGSSRVIK